MMTGTLFFVSLLGFALGLMMLLPRLKAGAALLCALCGMLFVSFWGGIMLEWLVPVSYALMYGGLALFVSGASAAVLGKRGMRERLVSPGLLFFVTASALLIWDAHGLLIQDHDSFSYWLRAVRELYTFDRFYIHADSNMFHMDYIPLMASLEYSIVRVFGWQDAFVTYVPIACLTASAAALTDLLPKKPLAFLCAFVMSFACQVFGFDPLNLRADGSMLMVFTAGLVSLLMREDDSVPSFLPVLGAAAVLTGFKIYSGLMFSVVLILAMFTEWLRKKGVRPLMVMTVLALVAALALQLGWSAKYNYAIASSNAESAALRAVYAGEAAEEATADVAIGELLSGNPRTAQLMHSFNEENIALFRELAAQTMDHYAHSRLIWAWAFVLAAAVMAFLSSKEERGKALRLILFLIIAGVVYLLGLFASYFVQSETSGADMVYLSTVSVPLLIASVFIAARLASERLRIPGYAAVAIMTAGMLLLCPPASLLKMDDEPEYISFAQHASEFYDWEMEGILTEEDANKRVLIIDSTYAATEIKSQSGKTHAYQYFGLPMRVLEPIYLIYGDYTQLETFDGEEILGRILRDRCDLLVLRIEDELYWEAVRDGLGLWGDWDEPIGVYDIEYADGEFTFTMREY